MEAGLIYTLGKSFRARAEAKQRQYRSEVLKTGWSKYGHFLSEEAQRKGANFVSPIAFEAAYKRFAQGKGVSKRTFENMLSSQAMCFNLFAPLAEDLGLASAVFRRIIPVILTVSSIQFEYTPSNDIFGDQIGHAGVGCDLLVEGIAADGAKIVIVIETKFVEPEFSICGFRVPGRSAKGQPVCPDNIIIDEDVNGCLYTELKKYRYWERTWEVDSLNTSALPVVGCPFGGPLWQLWVNHTIAQVEALRRGASYAIFAVCSAEGNKKLAALDRVQDFRGLFTDPDSVVHIGVDHLISAIRCEVKAPFDNWNEQLALRYSGI